ncbi:2-keto-4-pentenoate hydratase [Pseudomonas protegens]|uniref:2-keto-4-pentenoate hydratase n=1 Tax=Pseudomonas protegens TaxID=380021 RepID=UPI001F3B363C|nr:2-keto-4-pentenoate hydratase [Pseudomonas protegens]
MSLLQQLRQATAAARALPAVPAEALDLAAGYRLQGQALQMRQAAGEVLTGWKLACGGVAAQQRLGLVEPLYGPLTDVMSLLPGSRVDLARLIQPKLEIELAFILGRSLSPGHYCDADIFAAVSEVAPAFEIADCRWQGWRFGAGAFLADNAAAGLYCLGARQAFDLQRHAHLSYRLEYQGVLCASGATAGPEETPQGNLCWLVRRLLADGQPLEAGQLLLSGALLHPLTVQPGQYRLAMLESELVLDFQTELIAG